MVDLEKVVEKCKLALDLTDPAGAVEELIRETIADSVRLRAAVKEKMTGTSSPYLLLFRSDALTVVHVATMAGLRSPVHDHNMWAVIGLYEGEEHNRFYQEENGVLKQVAERQLSAGDVAVFGPETIHAVVNPLESESYALHVYGGDAVTRAGRSMWNPHTMAREEFDLERSGEYTRELSANR